MVTSNLSSPIDDFDPDQNYFDLFQNSDQHNYYSVDEYNEKFVSSTSNLTIFNINIRSFFKNIEPALAFLSSISYFPDVIVLSETWLRESDVQFANIEGYDGFHTLRDGRSGGVSVFCSKSLKCVKLNKFSLSNETIESCCVRVDTGGECFSVLAIYRPVSGSVSNFNEVMDCLLSEPVVNTSKFIIAGDLNINLLNVDNSDNLDFISNLRSSHFLPTILKPTRFPTGNTFMPTLLDHIWINFIKRYSSGIIWSDITDHCPVFICIPIENVTLPDKIKIEFREQHPLSVESFLNDLVSVDWGNFSGNVNQRFVEFTGTLSDLYCKNFPQRTKFVSAKRIQKPWLTSAILTSIKNKSKYFKQYKQGLISKQTNNQYRNSLNKIIRKAKINYHMCKFKSAYKNIKQTWKNVREVLSTNVCNKKIKSIIIDGNLVDDPEQMVEHFNKFFTNIAANLERDIPLTSMSPLKYIKRNHLCSLFLYPVTAGEVSKIIAALKLTGQGLNAPPVWLWKKVRDVVAEPISNLINCCFVSGEFPSCLKEAIITAILKGGSELDINNFRPISILLLISKILEKTMFSRILDFANKNSILSCNQFGFRPGLSTCDALLKYIEHIYDSLNKKHGTISVSIDLKKAFDTINHQILLDKLYLYGIRGLPLSLLKSYLTDRHQAVKIGNFISTSRRVTCGVPQGSCLGPLLFLLYINDLPNVSKNLNSLLFADDTTVYSSGSDLLQLSQAVNDDLQKISTWCRANRLSLNVQKTCGMVFTFNKNLSQPLTINDNLVPIVVSSKFLGLNFDDRLNFSDHINSLRLKLSKTVGIFYKLKDYVPRKILIDLYYSLFYPHLIYCNILWGGTFDTHLQKIYVMQKKCIRIIAGAPFNSHTGPLFKSFNILNIFDIYKFSVCKHMFKELKLGHFNIASHRYSTRGSTLIQPSFQRLTTTQKSINFKGPQIWNSLPKSITDLSNFNLFKKNLKNYLISKYS